MSSVLLKDTLGYLGRSFWGLPDREEERLKAYDRGMLYQRWGLQSGELDDFKQSFESLKSIELDTDELNTKGELKRCEVLLSDILELLRLRLVSANEDFQFLSDHRLRIELRDLDFKSELHKKVAEFMDDEEMTFANGDEVKALLLELDLQDEDKEKRKVLLEAFESGLESISQEIEKFYLMIKEYVEKG